MQLLTRQQAEIAQTARLSMLAELAASIVHEINQPLSAITISGEAGLRWLDRPHPSVEEVRASFKQILAETRRLAHMIAGIRAMAARREPDRRQVSIDDVIHDALLFLRHEVQTCGVVVLHYGAPSVPNLLANRTQLQQVMVNLILNAMQLMTLAGRADRKITIRTSMPDAAIVRCTIEDSGPGIKPEHLSRLFQSFFTTKEDGMGMGLFICRSIIEAHGGRITADNDTDLGGARFCLTLPSHPRS